MSVRDLDFVTIIIPTYRDWDRLKICISAILAQTYPKEFFEVIIVNNENSGTIPEDLYNSLPENFRIISELKSGSYSARNAALKICNGNILGFTDSDCIPHPNWIQQAVNTLNNKKVHRIAGKIELFYHNPSELTDAELYESVFSFKQEEVAKKLNSAVTGNMFAFKYVFDNVGDFNDSLYSGGDHEWANRAQLAGFAIAYDQNSIILHPARRNMSEIIKKAKRIGGGAAYLKRHNMIKTILVYLMVFKPSLFSIKMIRKYGSNLSFLEKLRVFALRFYLINVSSWERFTVSMGKKANRE